MRKKIMTTLVFLVLCAVIIAGTYSYTAKSLEQSSSAEEYPLLLPLTGEKWFPQAGLRVMELDHGWIVRLPTSYGSGAVFVPKPQANKQD
jgi:TRAP-type C4-dicarboxylate transport system permease small subunit